MTKSTIRAERRIALAKKKKRAQRVYPYLGSAKLANHLKCCSCCMCGNPRKYFGQRTIQELRAEEATSVL